MASAEDVTRLTSSPRPLKRQGVSDSPGRSASVPAPPVHVTPRPPPAPPVLVQPPEYIAAIMQQLGAIALQQQHQAAEMARLNHAQAELMRVPSVPPSAFRTVVPSPVRPMATGSIMSPYYGQATAPAYAHGQASAPGPAAFFSAHAPAPAPAPSLVPATAPAYAHGQVSVPGPAAFFPAPAPTSAAASSSAPPPAAAPVPVLATVPAPASALSYYAPAPATVPATAFLTSPPAPPYAVMSGLSAPLAHQNFKLPSFGKTFRGNSTSTFDVKSGEISLSDFLFSFETAYELARVPREIWPRCLATHCEGAAAQLVRTALSSDRPVTYHELRGQLQQRFTALDEQSAFTGPYKVLRQATGGNYILSSTRNQPLHRSYPLDQLKLVDQTCAAEIWTAACSTKLFPLDCIVDHRYVNGALQFLLQWKGHDSDFNSWETESAIADPDMVAAYWDSRAAPAQ